MSPTPDYPLRKAQLIAQADLERLRMRHASRQIKELVSPAPAQASSHWVAPVAGTALALLLPALGKPRAQRLVRTLTWALMAYRAYRNWKSTASTSP